MQGEQVEQDVSPYDSYIFENEQVEPDMSPLTRHEFDTIIKSLVKTIRTGRELTQNKFESMEIALESAITNTKNLTIETAQNFEKSRQYQIYLNERGNTMVKGYNSLNERANNLEMKLRKRGYLSKEHAIDYVPYINLPDKHKRGAPSLPTPLSLSHKTRTTISNKYIVL